MMLLGLNGVNLTLSRLKAGRMKDASGRAFGLPGRTERQAKR